MKTAVIVAAGAFPRTEYPRYLISTADLVVCCDGALSTLEKHAIVPDVVIGDMDSVCGRALKRFGGTKIHISGQDDNDLTKAFDHIMTEHPEVGTVHILGASGRREDHTIANYSLLMEYETRYGLSDRGIAVDMVSDYSTAMAVSDSVTLHVGEGRQVSIFTPDSTLSIKSSGLHWPLDGVRFDNWWKASLNRADQDAIRLELSHRAPVLIILT